MDLFLAPHNDDETLFGAYTVLRYRPHVIVCLRSEVQKARGTGITAAMRESETGQALRWLGDPSWQQLPFSDADPDWKAMEAALRDLDRVYLPERVFVPEQESDGHEHHNAIGVMGVIVFSVRAVPYLTYRRGFDRTIGIEVEFEPDWPAKKLRAMSCYESQIMEPSTRFWFIDSGLREYVPSD